MSEGIDPVPIPVYRNRQIIAYAAVDANLAPLFLKYRWQLHNKGYAVRTTRKSGRRRVTYYLHREVFRIATSTNAPSVDHLNGHKLDCRLKNLDACSLADNSSRAQPANRFTREQHDPPPPFCGRVLRDEDLPPF